MKTYVSAHKAAVAHAGKQASRVTDWIAYADTLIRQGTIRPMKGNGSDRWYSRWYVIDGSEWWIVRTEVHKQPEIEGGPFETKRAALASVNATTSKKLYPGSYVIRFGEGWSQIAVTTRFAQGMGLAP
jgi:hypothetical protein